MSERYDAVVIGSGPNGLAAAVALARAGLGVHVIEANDTAGGGTRTLELTLPGIQHDLCSSVHPLGITSPWFRALELDRHGLQWVHPSAPLAHLLDDGRAVMLERSLEDTAAGLGRDGDAYRRLMEPLLDGIDDLFVDILGPLRVPTQLRRYTRFGLLAMRSLEGLARSWFHDDAAGALLGGIAAHATVPLDSITTSSFGLVMALAGHRAGWPIARGGSRAISDALIAELLAHGGTLELGTRITQFDQLPTARAYLFDTDPRQLVDICADQLSQYYRDRVGRFRYGPGVFKVDWALSSPVPWRDPACRRAGTVHLSGTIRDIIAAQKRFVDGEPETRPFMLFGQPTVIDPGRATTGHHTAWGYCHVPANSDVDMTEILEQRIEEFAPGFRDTIVARASIGPRQLMAHDANYIGGDINGGVPDWKQLMFRPVASVDPYFTGAPGIFICSSSTPPGAGVHGMCGYWAAASALRRVFDLEPPSLDTGARALTPHPL